MERTCKFMNRLDLERKAATKLFSIHPACDSCGAKTDDVRYRRDPYLEEIHNEIVYEWFCDDCYRESLMDI
jgi:hypothetical protein